MREKWGEAMYAVEMRGITKQFKNVLANSNVDLLVQRGEIHSLLGENGAGKSTLMNILYCMYAPTSGEISVQGKPVKIENPLKAIELGIAMVHQHFMLIEPMTVAENVVLGYEPKKNGCFDFKKAVSDVEALAKEYGLYVDAREKVENLSVGTKQRVRSSRPSTARRRSSSWTSPRPCSRRRRSRTCSRCCAGSRRAARPSSSSPTSSRRPWPWPTR